MADLTLILKALSNSNLIDFDKKFFLLQLKKLRTYVKKKVLN